MPDLRSTGPNPSLIHVSAAKTFFTTSVNVDRAYSVEHLSINNLGGGDTNPVVVVTSGNSELLSIPHNYSAISNSCVLMSGRVVTLGPGVTSLICVCLSGTPMLNILPTEPFFGRF